MRYAQFFIMSTGYVAGSIPPRFDAAHIAPIEACGSDSVCILDGCYRIARCVAVARAELKAARDDAAQVIAALREAGSVTPEVCAILRRNLESARHDMRDAIGRIEAATARIADLDMTGEF